MVKSKRGKIAYVPISVIDEIEDIKQEDGLVGFGADASAFNELVKNAQVGREAKRIMRLDFRKRKKR